MGNYKEYIVEVADGLPYPIGTEVFIVTDKDYVLEAHVRSYRMEVGKDKRNIQEDGSCEEFLVAFPRAITTEYFILQRDYFYGHTDYSQYYDSNYAPLNRVFSTKEEADKNAKFFPVNLEDEVWYSAVGLRDKIETIDGKTKCIKEKKQTTEDSELGVCCASISSVRDLIYKAKERGGLIQLDIDILISNFESCPVDLGAAPNLKKIFDMLGINNV